MRGLNSLLAAIVGLGQKVRSTEPTQAPPWAGRASRMRKGRSGAAKLRINCTVRNTVREEFRDKEIRNARFAQLRGRELRGLTKFSDVKDGRSIWCVAYPGQQRAA